MIDRTSKIFLALIAAGLWANLAGPFLRPVSAEQDYTGLLINIGEDLRAIKKGICSNPKIC
jgi:hypothetical protein